MGIQIQKFDPQVLITASDDGLAEITASLIVKAFKRLLTYKEHINFIPSSGNTPKKTYQILATRHHNAIDWSRVRIIQMDEYFSSDLNPEMYFKTFLQDNLVDPLGIGETIFMQKPDTRTLYTPEEYKQKIKAAGPLDFALHGIGRNGHIGFNEPNSAVDSETRNVILAETTSIDNFPNSSNSERSIAGMTLGLKELQAVAHTLLIATGKHKAEAIRDLINYAPTSQIPACALWNTPDFGVIVDKAAARLIK